MKKVKETLADGEIALGTWNLLPHPNVAEILAGEGFQWICVDMEHSSHTLESFENAARAIEGKGKEVFVRLPSCDPVAAKKALDLGARGIIVPSVNTPEEAKAAVAMAKYPPEGIRGASLARCTDYGRNFAPYFEAWNEDVTVVVMLEHIEAVRNVDAILSVPGIDAIFIGPYDLSASMNLAGQLEHPEVRAAQKTLLKACIRHGVAPGIHIVPVDPKLVADRIAEGFRFLALGLDTTFIAAGCRQMLSQIPPDTE